ncbi:MAG: SprB repeat-containing protein, partial [Flavobacterium sp.]
MKKLYLLLIFLFFGTQYITAQTTETFEGSTVSAANFTSASKTFNLTSSYGTFTVFNGATQGYGGSNRFLQVSDSAGPEALGQFGTITAAAGSFKVSNFWIYLTGDSNQNAGVTSNGAAGSVTFTGKLAGVTQFTVVKNTSGANIGYTLPGNGFIYTNFVTDGAADYTNVVIDQLVIQLSANYDYFAIDNFTFANGAVAPTVTTTAATNVKAVSATIGGNVTADGGDATIERGIVWATTTNPTILSNKVQIGTGTGAFTNTVTGFPPGSLIYYRSYATNSGGTSYGAQLTLTTNAGLGTAATGQSNVSCFGGSNGTATVIANGGGAPYTYLWTNGATTATASGLGVGPISVTITDSELSQITRNFTITQPSTIVGTPSVTNVSCNGGSNGTATITATGGAPGYTYLWSNGATTATATGLLAGNYSVTITDDNSCTRTVNNIIVAQPSILNATPSVTNVSCFGGSNGTATITASGGTGSRTYLWSNGATTATASGLTAGTYSVTVTDANSCTRTVSNIIVGTPSSSVSGTTSTTPVSCFGGSNGTATVTPGGGTPGYTYLWSNGATGATATGLLSGTYSVTITDANSCTGTISNIVVGGPSAIISASLSTTSVSCFGGSNGTATITASGGTPGYTYLWSNGATTATATGLIAGTYNVTVTDSKSCTRTVNNIIIGTSTVINAAATQVNVSCNGGNNGSATVTPTGGAGSYTYLWSNGATTNSITGLTQGNYSVTITDANTCQATQNFTITQPALLVASQGAINNVSCNGGSNGSATVVTTGGTAPYTYLWAPFGGSGATASGLIQGTYTVTVTDSKLCQTTQTFTITEPAAFSVTTAQTNILCNGSATGSATVNVTGGTGAYT